MPKFDPYSLRKTYEQDADELQKLIDECMGKVVEWRWARSIKIPRQPFDQERLGLDEPGWSKENKKALETDFEHGLDSQGRSVLCRGGQFNEQACFLYEENQIIYIHMDRSKKIETVGRFQYDGSRLILKQWFNRGQAREIQLHWQVTRLLRSLHCDLDFRLYMNPNTYYDLLRQVEAGKLDAVKLEPLTPTPSFFQWTYEYDADEILEKIWSQEIGENDLPKSSYRELEYEKPKPRKKGPSTAKILKQIEKELIEKIPLAVQEAGITSPIYAVFICYCAEDPSAGWPPHLILALESYRQRGLDQFGSGNANLYYELWHPQELDTNPSVDIGKDSDELATACRQLVESMPSKVNYAPMKKMLRNAATQLNKFDWSAVPTTDDFIVAAVDASAEDDPIDNIKAVVPAKRLVLLQGRGLFPD